MRNILSCSFGKDSLALLLKCLENKYPIDEVVFVDTGMEFKAIYNIRDRILPILYKNKIKYTELKFDKPFEYYMFEHKTTSGKTGYSWCGGVCRWGTAKKLQLLNKHCKGATQLVGIAFDESHRIKNEPNKIYPLVDMKMTEKDCLNFCYSKGFYWKENGTRLYDILDRVSCWCCANKNLKELKNYQTYLPQYWQKIIEFQKRTDRLMKKSKKYQEWIIKEQE